MNKVHILGCGGPAGVGMTRCLKDHYEVTGEDSSQWAELMMECDKRNGFADLVIPLPDSLVATMIQESSSCFLPPQEQIKLCQDKARTAKVLGDLAPKTYWVRDTYGAGGAGAQMQSEYVEGDNFSQEFVYFEGELLATFQKRRVSYSVKSKTQGIDNRGSSAVSVCTNENDVRQAATRALDYIALACAEKVPGKVNWSKLHGFYGVDLIRDEQNRLVVTEVNAGRLLTASYAFFSHTGYNLPLVGAKTFLGEELPTLPDYPLGIGQIRQVGQLPRFFGPEITKDW